MYVAYGSNMHRGQMARRCPSAHFCGLARIPGCVPFINGRGVAGVRAWNPEAAAAGVLWDVDPGAMAALDRYEGVTAGLYRREEIRVETQAGSSVLAEIYIPEEQTFGVPHAGYQETLEEACMDLGIEPRWATSQAQWFEIDPVSGRERLWSAASAADLIERMRLAPDPVSRHSSSEAFIAAYAAGVAAATGRETPCDTPEAFVAAMEALGAWRPAKRAGQGPILYWPAA